MQLSCLSREILREVGELSDQESAMLGLAKDVALAAVSGLPLVNVLANDGVGGGSELNWLSYLLNGGPFAVVVFLLVTDRLTTPGERDRLRRELTASHEREASLNETIREEFVPNVTRSIEAMGQNKELMERVLVTLEKVLPLMERVETFLSNPRKGD